MIPSDPQARHVRAHERHALALSFAYFFCVLSAYYVIRPVRDQFSAAVGSTQLPWFYGATFIATLVLTPLFSALVARFPRRRVLPLVYGFFIACLLAFIPLFGQSGVLGARSLGIVFYVWISVFNLFVVSVFWSFMADIWDEAQARRLFPIIALGGTAGAIAGPVLTRMLVGVIGVPSLLLVSAALLSIALALAMWLGRWARLHGARRLEAGQGEAIGGGMLDGLRQIFADPFIRTMAGLMLLGDAIGTVNYALIVDYSSATFDTAVERTRFAATLDLWTNGLVVLTQLTLTRWLLVRFGAGAAIAGWAGTTAAVLVIAMSVADPYAPLLGMVPWIGVALIVSRGLAYGMLGPARESLFTRVPRGLRYKGKNAVDTAVWRFGDFAVGSSMNLLRGFGVGVAGFAGLAALAATASGLIGWRLAKRTDERV